jgi:aldehyde:ferredoxin oxidoreductase
VDDLPAIAMANQLCNMYGLDTISTGVTISCAMELAEKGCLPIADVGRPLHFGDADAVIELVQKTAYREGFGDRLAEGSYRLATSYGHPELSMTARKLEMPGYDPRGSKGMGLLYATSSIGASHMMGDLAYMEVFGVPRKLDPLAVEGKAAYIKHFEDLFALVDSAGLCVFLAIRYLLSQDYQVMPTRLTQMLNHATGAGYTSEDLLHVGDRIFNLERLYLLGAGCTGADDTLPPRMLAESLPEGPGRGHVVELDRMLPEFYRLRGWDENGVPTAAKLASLGLNG